MKPLVLYHDSCADGFCAAWVAWKYFGDGAEYLPVQYGQAPPDVTGREVFILDFSYKRPVLLEMAKKVTRLTVLDHHKTAAEDLRGFGDEPELDNAQTFVEFDMDKSGGRLAWEYFFQGRDAPLLVAITEDRDLWRWQLHYSREMNAALASYPHNFATWNLLSKDADLASRLRTEGAAILRYQRQLVQAHVKNAAETEIDGHKVLTCNATCLISEIGEALAQDRPFAATYFVRQDGKRVYSLRSRGEGGLDVSEVAKRHGGGGHRGAAGWTEGATA